MAPGESASSILRTGKEARRCQAPRHGHRPSSPAAPVGEPHRLAESLRMDRHNITQPTLRNGGGGTSWEDPSGGIPSPPIRRLRERATRLTERHSGGVGFALRGTRPFSQRHHESFCSVFVESRAVRDRGGALSTGSAATGQEARATESKCKGVGLVNRDRRRSTGRLSPRGYAPRNLAPAGSCCFPEGVEARRVR